MAPPAQPAAHTAGEAKKKAVKSFGTFPNASRAPLGLLNGRWFMSLSLAKPTQNWTGLEPQPQEIILTSSALRSAGSTTIKEGGLEFKPCC